MPFFSSKIPSSFEGKERLDKYIASLPPETFGGNSMNRSKLKSGASEILLNGKKTKVSAKVKAYYATASSEQFKNPSEKRQVE